MSKGINRVVQYFDLQSQARGRALAQEAGQDLKVLPQYVSLVLGIIVQPFFDQFRHHQNWDIDLHKLAGWTLFSVITGVVIFPSVYRKSFNAGQPKFVQFCAIFTTGLGWEALLSTTKAVAQ